MGERELGRDQRLPQRDAEAADFYVADFHEVTLEPGLPRQPLDGKEQYMEGHGFEISVIEIFRVPAWNSARL
jgi:hypothetical protein